MHGIDLHWLPNNPHWAKQLASVAASSGSPLAAWDAFAHTRLSAFPTKQLDRRRGREVPSIPPGFATKPVRATALAASPVEHPLSAIRVGGLRHSIWINTYTFCYALDDDDLILTLEMTADDIGGWSSMSHIFIAVELQTRFCLKLRAAEMKELKKLVTLVELKLAKWSELHS